MHTRPDLINMADCENTQRLAFIYRIEISVVNPIEWSFGMEIYVYYSSASPLVGALTDTRSFRLPSNRRIPIL